MFLVLPPLAVRDHHGRPTRFGVCAGLAPSIPLRAALAITTIFALMGNASNAVVSNMTRDVSERGARYAHSWRRPGRRALLGPISTKWLCVGSFAGSANSLTLLVAWLCNPGDLRTGAIRSTTLGGWSRRAHR